MKAKAYQTVKSHDPKNKRVKHISVFERPPHSTLRLKKQRQFSRGPCRTVNIWGQITLHDPL